MASTSKIKQMALAAGAATLLGLGAAATSAPALAQASNTSDYRNQISNNMRSCAPGGGPAVRVTINGIKSSTGKVRAQVYNGTRDDWLERGRWLNRIELPARRGRMVVCMPVPASGTYAIAVRHDANGNGETDISEDGGAMSNNPSINIFNLGKPGVDKTRFNVGNGVSTIAITMKYLT
ncbi:hypothetical protein NAP1_13468 [Erythrobacter sp. NAP1]|uniref:DUF2141 domain-containing protein n=1 Tax=Erythrobacter sp. NAP1 TaxID=237727 RepID=UPI000068774D|nr:DUF2141 domain-containing protein [Erythrobacter sp. NAP1]EAQ28611.1 hypothetical protein NAP1_13468 [Erythrobacter sp. NAP1]